MIDKRKKDQMMAQRELDFQEAKVQAKAANRNLIDAQKSDIHLEEKIGKMQKSQFHQEQIIQSIEGKLNVSQADIHSHRKKKEQ